MCPGTVPINGKPIKPGATCICLFPSYTVFSILFCLLLFRFALPFFFVLRCLAAVAQVSTWLAVFWVVGRPRPSVPSLMDGPGHTHTQHTHSTHSIHGTVQVLGEYLIYIAFSVVRPKARFPYFSCYLVAQQHRCGPPLYFLMPRAAARFRWPAAPVSRAYK